MFERQLLPHRRPLLFLLVRQKKRGIVGYDLFSVSGESKLPPGQFSLTK